MYRAVTWYVLNNGIAVGDEAAIAAVVEQCQIQLTMSNHPEFPTHV
jgi:pantoate ligase/cytidylate kinase